VDRTAAEGPDPAGRPHWVLTPQVSVGPLHFGIRPDEVARALDDTGTTVSVRTHEQWYPAVGVHAYFSGASELACVAVDGRIGPQVTVGGRNLVGCRPSEVEAWFGDYTRTHGLDWVYTHEGDPGSVDLGIMMRAQRLGDVVVTRPLFMIREWAEQPWDHVPGSEWGQWHGAPIR